LSKDEAKWFHTVVAKVFYLARINRADLLCACSFLLRKVTCSTVSDMKKLKRLLAYLNGTRNMGVVLVAGKVKQLHCYVDAAFANHSDMKSHTGCVIMFEGGPLLASSNKQATVSRSSTEAELIAASKSVVELIHLRNFVTWQENTNHSAVLHQDNKSTIKLLLHGRDSSKRTRHIDIANFWLKEQIDLNIIEVEWTNTADMIADILTKPLQGELFRRMRARLLNWPTTVHESNMMVSSKSVSWASDIGGRPTKSIGK
jgi:hypothetical protein